MGHVFSVGLYGDYLIVCDRAGTYDPDLNANVNVDSGGTKIYKINKEELNVKDLLKLTTTPVGGMPCMRTEAQAIIAKLTNNTNPLVVLPTKLQRYDNCAFISQRSLVEATLLVLFAEHCRYNLASEHHDVREIKRFAEVEYAGLCAFLGQSVFESRMRERSAVIRLIGEADGNPGEKLENDLNFYNQLVIAILKEHYGQDRALNPGDVEREFVSPENKKADEVKRASAILFAFDGPEREAILQTMPELKPA